MIDKYIDKHRYINYVQILIKKYIIVIKFYFTKCKKTTTIRTVVINYTIKLMN